MEKSGGIKSCEWQKCPGEAHSNPYIDHCGVCLPFWAEYPICPNCKTRLTGFAKNPDKKTGTCNKCNEKFSVVRE